MVWEYLFDSEYSQRRDIELLKQQSVTSASVANDSLALGLANRQHAQRIGRLELTVEALVRVLQTRLGLTREELGLMIQRIDLADGVEDGAIGPDRTKMASDCPRCGKPLNPRRDRCLFCDAPIEKRKAKPAPPPPPPKMVTCVRCNAKTPERESYFSGDGLLCSKCFLG